MQVYKIAGWDKHFENNRTRELKVLSWVPFPNKHDGDGYTELMDHKDAAAHFGCWCAIVEVASKCDPRGTLLRDGQNGVKKPHDADSLSRMTRISAKVLEAAIKRLIDIGWITTYDDPALRCDSKTALGCASRARVPEGKGRERREGKGSTAPEIPPSLNAPEFLKAWEDWKTHRQEIKKPLTEQSSKMQMKDFETWGIKRAIAAIEHTVKKGWQGIREPDGREMNQQTPSHKLFPDQALKLCIEWRSKRAAYWNRYARLTAQGEQLPNDRKAEYETIRTKIREYEGML